MKKISQPKATFERMRILKRAKVYYQGTVKNYPFVGLCNCINGGDPKDVLILREYISKCLGRHNLFVTSWLVENGHAQWSELTNENIQAYRLAWLDQLIKDFTP